MFIKQISVFLENKAGRLAEITGVLAANEINIKAMSIADTNDFGILRLIVDDPESALASLKTAGFRVRETSVVGILLEHKPGGLHKVLKKMEEKNISVEYIYDCLYAGDGEYVTIIVKLEKQDEAVDALKASGVRFLNG